MGLRDALRRLRGSEEQRVIDAVPWDVGGSLRPAAVSVDQALGLVPVFAAVRLLSSQVASLPLQTYRKTGDTRQKIAPFPLFVHPSVQGTLYDWLHRCMTSLALRGNAFGYITQRDRDQYPTMIEWLHPDDVRVDDRMPSGPGSYTNPVWYWQGRVIPAEDLLHIPWFTVPGRILGLSPIGACAATISTGLSAQVYTSDWFDSGAVPPGEFKNTAKTVNQTEADIISARLNAAIKRRKPLVYGNDWEYKPIAVAAHEAKFIETMRMNATQIASIYGIPPEMIGGEAGGPLTYNTVESNAAGLEKFTLRPWLTLLEAAFFQLMPRPQYVKFNVDSLLRTDLQTRMASYQTGRQIGLYNIDEARAIEDLPPLPNGEGQDYTPLQILTGRATQPATQTRYLPRHASDDYIDAEVIDVRRERRRELRHSPGGHMHNQLAHGGDLLDLAGRIDLGDGESFVSSGRLDPDGAGSDPAADVLFAVVDTPRGTRVRVGVIPFEDVPRWRAGNKGGTADLDLGQVGEFHTRLSEMNGQAKTAAERADDSWNSGHAPTDPVLAGTAPVAAGRIGSGWQPLKFEAWLTDDEPTSWQVSVEVGDDPTAEPSTLDPKDTRKLIGKLAELTGGRRALGAAVLVGLQSRRGDPTDPAAMTADHPDWDPAEPDPDADDFVDEVYGRAATPDGLKGGARLKAYWTSGPGLAKWAASAHPWTALYRHLRKYMPARKAKATAAAWFHAVKGYWPGHQKGKNPVGPG